jgi:putative component of membrane protein insertase Oxa1/YidC/SpoIIIJ protein YidD
MKLFTILMSLVLLSLTINAQQVSGAIDSKEFVNLFEAHDHGFKERFNFFSKSRNEVEFSFNILFKSYKEFFSSQDYSSCNFTPSCSEYGYLAIKEHGTFLGIPLTFDRLTRCHRLTPQQYSIDKKTGLFIDNP